MQYQNQLKLTQKNFPKHFKTWQRNMLAGNYQTLLNKSFQIRTKKRVEPGNKKNTVNNDNGNENKLSKFDTRSSASVSKQSNKIKPAKINIPRKITKK